MKEVKKILCQSLERLKGPFSNEWLSEFSLLMEFITTNTHTNLIISSIEKEKQEDYASLTHNLKALFKDGKVYLQRIQKQIKNPETRSAFKPQIQSLLQAKVDHKKIADPFFKLETAYLDYIAGFSRLLEGISQSDANALVENYATVGCNLNIDLSFSPFLKSCKHDVEILSGLRTKEIWGRWDLLLQWLGWTKNGISPGNQAFQKNLSSMFKNLKISKAIECCGSYFLKRLANMKTVSLDAEICLKALELFLDQDDQYWIIAHFSGEKGEKSEFFIKKLQREAQSYALLKLLLEAEPYSSIEFPRQSHTLGELEIKNELKKVFFPHKKFAGAFVKLSELDVAINATTIVKHLSSLQAKKHRPSLDNGYYFRSSIARV
ncbi:MAG: hypothetical protein WCN87_03395 [Chlamydiota bacterium]